MTVHFLFPSNLKAVPANSVTGQFCHIRQIQEIGTIVIKVVSKSSNSFIFIDVFLAVVVVVTKASCFLGCAVKFKICRP